MHLKKLVALCGAISLLSAGAASAATTVSVRVEGLKRPLLAPAAVHTHTGSITKGGAPQGGCPAASAAGALDVATHHRWAGKWYSSFNDYLIQKILGEAENGTTSYWGIWVNNRFATTGVCEIKLHNGDQLLFAADSVKHHEHPIGIKAPRTATVGHTFNVRIVSFSDSGKATPLAGAQLSVAGKTFAADKNGIVPLKPSRAGTAQLTAAKAGYIRPAPVSLRVTG